MNVKINQLSYIFLLFILLHTGSYSVTINIVYPREGDIITAAAKDSSFIFGQVTPAHSDFVINGEKIKVYPNGAFLGYLQIQAGDFVFDCLAINDTDTLRLERRVYITLHHCFNNYRKTHWNSCKVQNVPHPNIN